MKTLVFGEILFDVYPDTVKLGGAPMNFGAHMSKLGSEVYIVSAVGADDLGDKALKEIGSLDINTDYIGKLSGYDTGVCNVTYSNGEPQYDLSKFGAYDYVELNSIDEISNQNFDVFYFGTLAQRNKASSDTLKKILNTVNFNCIFFDMNLRQRYYSDEIILNGLTRADIVKLNRDEYKILKSILGSKNDDREFIEKLCKEYNIRVLLLTLDKDGAVVYDGSFYQEPCVQTEFVSAVGAGDSFSACFVKNYLSGVDTATCIKRANALAAYVVGFEMAIPQYTQELIKKII